MGDNDINVGELLIKGQNHYQKDIISIFKKKSDGFAQELDIEGFLEPEPTNKQDPNAVRLRVDGKVVGYIAREKAQSAKEKIGNGVKVSCKLLWNRDPETPMFSIVVTSVH